MSLITEARKGFHAAILDRVLTVNKAGIPSNADKDNKHSVSIARGIATRLGEESRGARLAGQSLGNRFEELCEAFLTQTFLELGHLRPGSWHVQRIAGRKRFVIADFDQYEHLITLDKLAQDNRELAVVLGNDYAIAPDIIIFRDPESDEVINRDRDLVDLETGRLTRLREINWGKPSLHASVSCKWTIRSDRVQNARAEALNLIRNRKGHLPHVVVVTAEPTPGRIASIALGTGDIDCVYHFALPELRETLEDLGYIDSLELLGTMIEGKRLRDIADLPLDIAI